MLDFFQEVKDPADVGLFPGSFIDQVVTGAEYNIMIERLWKGVKYEDVYLKAYDSIPAAREGLKTYFKFYNSRRRHQSLDRKIPDSVYWITLPQKQAAI